MKRDMNLIRRILLDLQSNDDKNVYPMEAILRVVTQKDDCIVSDARLMIGAGLHAPFTGHNTERRGKYSLSSAGCELLDSVRDEELWRKTKKAAESIKSFGIETLRDIAKRFIAIQIKRLSGVEA